MNGSWAARRADGRRLPEHVRDLARAVQTRAASRAGTVLRYDLVGGEDLLAAMASRGAATPEQVLAHARGQDEGSPSGDLAARLDGRSVAALATTLLAGDEDDLAAAGDLLRLAVRLGGLDAELAGIAAQVHLLLDRTEAVEEVLRQAPLTALARWQTELDLLNPGPEGHPDAAWTAHLGAIFAGTGLLPVTVRPGPGAPFDRLAPAAPVEPVDGPLVTVVMAVHAPDQSLWTSVRSITGQSWTNLQVVMVDDASGPDHAELIDRVAASDPRIELVRAPVNGGSYRSRNLALERARGVAVTFQDADDWSHPQRVERQARALLGQPGAAAVVARSLRLHADLRATHLGFPAVRKNLSSLMVRREVLAETLGGFDVVRKGGDSELIRRLRSTVGAERVLEQDEVSAVVQLTTGSLSRADFRYRWHHPDRVAYQEAFDHWHEAIARGEASPVLPREPRAFPAPPAFLGLARPAGERVDVAVVSGVGRDTSRYHGLERELGALAGSDLSVALLRSETPRFARSGRARPHGDVLDLYASGRLRRWEWDAGHHARTVVVRDPELLVFPRRRTEVTADRVLLVAGHAPRTPEDLLCYDPADVQRHAEQIFGTSPVWVPATAEVAEGLVRAGATGVEPPRLLAVAPPVRRRRAGPRAGDRLVVGTSALERFVRDRPSAHVLPGPSARLDVRVLDALGGAAGMRQDGQLAAGWLVLEDSDVSLLDFLDQLDVFVDVAPRSWGPRLSGDVVAAVARGAVPVLGRDDGWFAPVHLPAALPDDLPDLLGRWLDDPAALTETRESLQDHVATHLGAEAYLAALAPTVREDACP